MGRQSKYSEELKAQILVAVSDGEFHEQEKDTVFQISKLPGN